MKFSWSIIFLMSCLAISANAQDLDDGQEQFKGKSKIDTLAQPYLQNGRVMGFSLGIVSEGKTYFLNYGQASDKKKTSATADTLYEIGSISKVFTSIILAEAVSSGELELTSTVGDVVAELKGTPVGNEISLLNLSTHTSRLVSTASNVVAKDPDNPYADYDRKSMFTFLKAERTRDGIGEDYAYSNLGAGLLGEIVSINANKSYEDVLRDNVLAPLNMNDTCVDLNKDQKKRLAPPYNSLLLKDHAWDFDALVGAGGIRSTTRDMVRFMEANLNPSDDAIGKALQLAWTKQLTSSNRQTMGLGWHFDSDGETRWHNGGTGGYHSMLMINREKKTGIILLANTDNSEMDRLAADIFRTVNGDDVQPIVFDAFSVDEATVKRLVGVYKLTPTVSIKVMAKGNRMMAKHTGQTFLEVEAISDTVWRYKNVDAELHFELPEKGKAKKLTLHQGGMKIPGKRK